MQFVFMYFSTLYFNNNLWEMNGAFLLCEIIDLSSSNNIVLFCTVVQCLALSEAFLCGVCMFFGDIQMYDDAPYDDVHLGLG